MTQSNPITSLPPLRERALRWVVRLHSKEAFDHRQLEAWLAEDPEHRREFDELSKLWTTLDRAKPLLNKELGQAEALWNRSQAKSTSGWQLSLRQTIRFGAMAAVFVALVVLPSWWWLTRPPEAVLYHTAKGEQQRIALADGSSVMLNTDSEIAVQFSGKERRITLAHGEAWFTVAHDTNRPFHVRAANGTIRDIGTQFIVNKSPLTVQVSVLDGIVEVGRSESNDASTQVRPTLLSKGQQIHYDEEVRLSAIEPFDESTLSAWTEGKLIFRTRPLAQVLAEVSRYRREELRLLDPSLAQVPVSGVFDIQNLGSFEQALQQALPIRATRVNAQLVIVERAPASSTAPKTSHR